MVTPAPGGANPVLPCGLAWQLGFAGGQGDDHGPREGAQERGDRDADVPARAREPFLEDDDPEHHTDRRVGH
jgi:hypothetical protein